MSARPFTTIFGFRTRAPAMIQALEHAARLAAVDAPVLVRGELGTGKGQLAAALHVASPRRSGPLHFVDCAADRELAIVRDGARLLAVAGGTLVLDAVDEIASSAQGDLRWLLERGELQGAGGPDVGPVDVRVIGLACTSLEKAVAGGLMRADLFHLLAGLSVDLPPLRERREDIPLLVEDFFASDPVARGCGVVAASAALLAQLAALPFPGNLRELLMVLRRAAVSGADRGVLTRLPPDLPAAAGESGPTGTTFQGWMRAREREYLVELVGRWPTAAERAAAAGISERTLYRRLKRLGIQADEGAVLTPGAH